MTTSTKNPEQIHTWLNSHADLVRRMLHEASLRLVVASLHARFPDTPPFNEKDLTAWVVRRRQTLTDTEGILGFGAAGCFVAGCLPFHESWLFFPATFGAVVGAVECRVRAKLWTKVIQRHGLGNASTKDNKEGAYHESVKHP